MQVSLQKLLKYKNNHIIARYQKEFPDAILSGDEALTELMKYIWLCRKHAFDKILLPTDQDLHFKCVIHVEMEEIDNMWHTFLLFTKDYHAFCNDYLNGVFFHHDPLPPNGNKVSKKQYEIELQRYLSYIYDHLGEESVMKWFGRE